MFKTILACVLAVALQTYRARGSRKLGSRVLFVLLSMFAVAPIDAKLPPPRVPAGTGPHRDP